MNETCEQTSDEQGHIKEEEQLYPKDGLAQGLTKVTDHYCMWI